MLEVLSTSGVSSGGTDRRATLTVDGHEVSNDQQLYSQPVVSCTSCICVEVKESAVGTAPNPWVPVRSINTASRSNSINTMVALFAYNICKAHEVLHGRCGAAGVAAGVAQQVWPSRCRPAGVA